MLQLRRGFPLLAFITMASAMTQPSAELDVQVTAARCRHPRAVQAPDGTIYVYGALKSNDGGKYFWPVDESDPPFGSYLFAEKLTSLFWRKGLFLGFYWNVTCREAGRCVGRMWRSRDGMKTVEKKETVLIMPEAGSVPDDDFSEVKGQKSSAIFFHRGIREMPDGTLLACMIGSFEQDNMPTTDPRSKMETPSKMRSFLMRSDDQGDTWRYFSTVAAPRAGVEDDTEGFNEWALLPLDDGRMLAVMRTGHYSPMVASWSDDGGRTWSPPADMGLGPGVDPYLLRLKDGRLALAYGQLVQRHGEKNTDWSQEDQRRKCQLAINADGTGKGWLATTVADYSRRMAYPTIFEVEPNVILYQSGECLELWRVKLQPR